MSETLAISSYDVPLLLTLKEVSDRSDVTVMLVNLWGLKEFIHSQLRKDLSSEGSNAGIEWESDADGCTLLCAFDDMGKVRLGHFPLFLPDEKFQQEFTQWGKEARAELDDLTVKCVMTGTNTSEAKRKEVEGIVSDVLQLPEERLMKVYAAASTENERRTHRMGMIYWFPARVVKNNRNTLLIVQEQTYPYNKPLAAERAWFQTKFRDELRDLLTRK